jgi:hypothetical protein
MLIVGLGTEASLSFDAFQPRPYDPDWAVLPELNDGYDRRWYDHDNNVGRA